jgi:hypothetical protein
MGLKVAGEHFSAREADFGGVQEVRTWLALLAERLRHKPSEQLIDLQQD